jgi:hypothetical protein
VPKEAPPVDAAYQLMVPAEAAALNITVPVLHLDADVDPVIVGMAFTVTAKVCTPLVPQEFPAVTVMFPFWPALPVVTVIAVVFCPAVIVQPVGKTQV